MNRFDIINRIVDKYCVGNTESGEFSYGQALRTVGKDIVFGKEMQEGNLKFIADSLGGKGTPREIICNHFLNDFYTDYLKIYRKRSIYWLFDGDKKNCFKTLIYMHRYRPNTIARIRTDYVHEQQSRYRTTIADMEMRINESDTVNRVRLTRQLN